MASKKKHPFLLPAIWAVVTFVASAWPGDRFPDFTEGLSDKLGHFAAYAIMSFLLGFAGIYSGRMSTHPVRWYIISFLSATFYGILLEFLQKWVFVHRSFDYLDMLANTIGVVLGLVLTVLYQIIIKKWLR